MIFQDSNMYTLKEIFNQAFESNNSVKSEMPKGISIIHNGVKIQKFEDRIEILNLGKGGSYYKVCDKFEYDFFKYNGWLTGCLILSVENCKHKLMLIEERIKKEVNTRKNDKHIQNLKNKREKALQKHAELKLKLNQLLIKIKQNEQRKLFQKVSKYQREK